MRCLSTKLAVRKHNLGSPDDQLASLLTGHTGTNSINSAASSESSSKHGFKKDLVSVASQGIAHKLSQIHVTP